MLYVLFGKDTFSRRKALHALQEAVGEAESRDANTTFLEGHTLTLGQLMATSQAMPFLAERRLVIVDGLLSEFNERERGRNATPRPAGRRAARDPGEWDGLPQAMQSLPPSTDVVFLEEAVSPRNPVFTAIKPLATVREFAPLPPDQLRLLVVEEARALGTPLSLAAQMVLIDLIGPDLWRLHNEIEKLSLYATGRTITEQDVAAMVSSTKEVSVFGIVDAVIDRNATAAFRHLQTLLQGDETVSHIFFMLARQVRFLLIAQELVRSNVPSQEMGPRLGILQEFPLRKTLEQARRYQWPQLLRFHSLLLDTDIAIKTGTLEEETALEVLIAEVCSTQGARTGGR